MKFSTVKNRQILKEFDNLLHRVLRDAYLYPGHLDYEDYYQELCLKLLNLAENFEGNIFKEGRYPFVAYARRGLSWFVSDLRRRQSRTQSLASQDITHLVDQVNRQQAYPHTYLHSQGQILSFIQTAENHLTPEEKSLFYYLIQDAYNNQELADIFSCSRQAIHQRRKKLRQKLAHLKNLLQA